MVWVWRVRSPTTQRAWKASMFTVQRRGFRAPEVQVSTREAPSAERRAPVAGAQDREWERGPLCRLCTRPGGQGGTGDGWDTKSPRLSFLTAGLQSLSCRDYKGKQMQEKPGKRQAFRHKSTRPGVARSLARLNSIWRKGSGPACTSAHQTATVVTARNF